MSNAGGNRKSMVTTAALVGLMSVSSLSAEKKSWEDDTVLVSKKGAETVVQAFKGRKVLFQNADPQLAIEWGMANARTTVVLAGKYAVGDRIDIPRDGVTLIIDQGADVSVNSETPITPAFRGRDGSKHPTTAAIYVRGRNHVRVMCFGKIRGGTFPVFFDGTTEKNTLGLEGGVLVLMDSPADCWLVDCRGVHVPLVAANSGLAAVLALEGCDDCKLGTIVNLASKPGDKTGEVVDLNSNNGGITVERLIGERSHEVIDNNCSHAVVQEIIAIGKPAKLLKFDSRPCARFTVRPSPEIMALHAWQVTVLEDAESTVLRTEAPKLPDALPRFTVKATVEVTMKDGSKKEYTKEVAVDVR